ncbi:hypothetical protein VTP01DRAFT_9995 [Rhizomucor pusillus]|uniref:uncharacterized protein n=1 Tax=Rhizomucor pusillus TaxID=4840 RepID=UPI0037437308
MLCILDIVVEYFDKALDDDASEVTFYRRFAMLLDVVFGDLSIKMIDGENVSNATKLAREHNLGTYGYDATSSFGRRIDLMLKLKDSTIELSSNEWKSKRTRHMLKKQQSKNIRSNCAILNKLFITSKMSINQTKAVDVVGSTGYLYLLQLKDDLYVSSVLARIFLPMEIDHLRQFKSTIKALFMWKDFFEEMIHKLKVAMLPQHLDADLGDIVRCPSPNPRISPLLLLFFTPQSITVSENGRLIMLNNFLPYCSIPPDPYCYSCDL